MKDNNNRPPVVVINGGRGEGDTVSRHPLPEEKEQNRNGDKDYRFRLLET